MQSLRSVSWRQQKRSASTQAPQHSMAMRAASASVLRSAQLVHSARRCLAASAFSSDAPSQPDGQGAWQRKPFPEITTITLADAEAHANRLQLSGNLGSDMQNVQTAFGMVGKIPLYVNTSMRDKSIKDVYTVELYGELAAQAVRKLRKGMRVNVEGRLRTEPYTDKKTGAERIQLTIEAEKASAHFHSFDTPSACHAMHWSESAMHLCHARMCRRCSPCYADLHAAAKGAAAAAAAGAARYGGRLQQHRDGPATCARPAAAAAAAPGRATTEAAAVAAAEGRACTSERSPTWHGSRGPAVAGAAGEPQQLLVSIADAASTVCRLCFPSRLASSLCTLLGVQAGAASSLCTSPNILQCGRHGVRVLCRLLQTAVIADLLS